MQIISMLCHSVPHVNLANYSVVNFDRKNSKSLWVNLIKNLNEHFHQFFNFPQMPPARNKFKWSAIIIIRVNFFFSLFFCVGLLKNIFCSEYIIFWWKVRGGEGGQNHRIFVVLYWVEGGRKGLTFILPHFKKLQNNSTVCH